MAAQGQPQAGSTGRADRLAAIESLLLANLHAVLPKSLLGRALHSLASQRSKLKRYVEDGRCSIDNNA